MSQWSAHIAARWKRASAVRPLDQETIALPWEEILAALAEIERLAQVEEDLRSLMNDDAADEEQ